MFADMFGKGSVPVDDCRVFETEFRGFRKQDVLNYIDELRTEQQKEREEREATECALREELAAEKQKTAALEQQLAQGQETVPQAGTGEWQALLEQERSRREALEQEKEEWAAQTAQTHQAIAALHSEKQELSQKLEEAENRLQRLQDLGQALCAELAPVLPAEEAEKPTETEQISPSPQEQPNTEPAARPMAQWLF